jgi:hypothetical protein
MPKQKPYFPEYKIECGDCGRKFRTTFEHVTICQYCAGTLPGKPCGNCDKPMMPLWKYESSIYYWHCANCDISESDEEAKPFR